MLGIVYASRVTQPLDAVGVRGLLDQARESNARAGVTGMLLHAHGSFLQHIEGDDDVVDAMFARIATDARHTDVRVLGRDPQDARAFEGWAMGYEQPADEDLAAVLPGYKPPADYPLIDAQLVHNATVARTLLRLYARNP